MVQTAVLLSRNCAIAVALSLVMGGVAAAADVSPEPASGVEGTLATAGAESGPRLAVTELECLTKVIVHEAGNQAHIGQLAVARVVLNRVNRRGFADSVCGVVNQRNQFFNTAAFNPSRASAYWQAASKVALEAQSLASAELVKGALFFANKAQAVRMRNHRQQVAVLGDHVFFR